MQEKTFSLVRYTPDLSSRSKKRALSGQKQRCFPVKRAKFLRKLIGLSIVIGPEIYRAIEEEPNSPLDDEDGDFFLVFSVLYLFIWPSSSHAAIGR